MLYATTAAIEGVGFRVVLPCARIHVYIHILAREHVYAYLSARVYVDVHINVHTLHIMYVLSAVVRVEDLYRHHVFNHRCHQGCRVTLPYASACIRRCVHIQQLIYVFSYIYNNHILYIYNNACTCIYVHIQRLIYVFSTLVRVEDLHRHDVCNHRCHRGFRIIFPCARTY